MLYLRRPEPSGNLNDLVCEVHGSGWLARRGAGAALKGMEGYLGDRAEGLRRARLFQLETKLIVYYTGMQQIALCFIIKTFLDH